MDADVSTYLHYNIHRQNVLGHKSSTQRILCNGGLWKWNGKTETERRLARQHKPRNRPQAIPFWKFHLQRHSHILGSRYALRIYGKKAFYRKRIFSRSFNEQNYWWFPWQNVELWDCMVCSWEASRAFSNIQSYNQWSQIVVFVTFNIQIDFDSFLFQHKTHFIGNIYGF